MNNYRQTVVSLVANISPYLSPLPSAFFVSRSVITHLGLPIVMGIVIGVIIETLGFSSVHTWLWLSDYNIRRCKSDPSAPAIYAFVLTVLYLIVTIGLTVLLEVIPALSSIAPALFPCLALVGAFDLALISQQQQREIEVKIARKERQEKRSALSKEGVRESDKGSSNLAKQTVLMGNSLDTANAARRRNKDTILDTIVHILNEQPKTGVTTLARLTGVRSRSTIYSYIHELESLGRIHRETTLSNSQ